MLLADPTASKGENLRRNVPGFGEAYLEAEAIVKQVDNPDKREAPEGLHISVIESSSEPGSHPGKKQARRKGKKKPGKRGPKGSTFLTMEQVRDVDGLAHMARREGRDLNLCITVRAPKGLSDAAGKRAIDGRLKHIGEALRERGQVWLAVWVYEKSPHLHAHVLVHVAPKNRKLVMRRHEGRGGAVHIRSADRFGPEYVTKQRQWRGPEIEDQNKRLWTKSARIEGPRIGYSKAAKELLARSKASSSVAAPMPYRASSIRLVSSMPVVPATTVAPTQFGLPLDWTPSIPTADTALMGQFCELFGYTQQQAAERLGYRDRSHVANVLRGHDGLSPARRKWVQYLLETGWQHEGQSPKDQGGYGSL
jgi:hypothetical protein